MAKQNTASAGARLFANKGKARPAGGLRAIPSETEHAEEAETAAFAVPAPETVEPSSAESELAEAASLPVGGFTTAALEEAAPSVSDVGNADPAEVSLEENSSETTVAGPADIDGALAETGDPAAPKAVVPPSALLARSRHLHPLVIAAAFAALLLASLGIGYGVSSVAGRSSTEMSGESTAPRGR